MKNHFPLAYLMICNVVERRGYTDITLINFLLPTCLRAGQVAKYISSESQKAKTFRIARFLSQKLSG